MKTYLISITSDCEGLKENYIDTIHKIKDSAEPIMVSFLPQPPQVDFQVIPVGCPYPGNLNRFDYFPKGFDDYDMIIFTDASDVIFQKEIPPLEEKIYVSQEYDVWGADNWWKDKIELYKLDKLIGFPIYCMGTWAMPYIDVKDLLNFINTNRGLCGNSQFSDQILFNLWLQGKDYSHRTDLFGSLYSGFEKKNITKTKKGFVNKSRQIISIVHANGGTKDLLIKK